MNRITAVFFCLSLIHFSAFTQEQLPTQQKATFSEDGKLYISRDLGVYFWLSTSPDENAPKHRLKSDSSKKYSNPMYFDTEGYNTLRSPSAVDPNTKKTIYPLRDVVFELYADGIAPKTTHDFVSGKYVYRSGKRYYGNNAAVVISAKDAVSGIEKTYFSIDGKPYSEYKDTLKLNTEGEISLKYYSTDRVGNREEAIEANFIIDNSAPTTDYEIDGIQNEKFVSPNATLKFSSEDNLVGVKAIYYKVNNGPRQVYSSPVSVKLLGDDGALSFYAVDYLNNTEELQVIGGKGNELNIGDGAGGTFEFYVDNSAPSISLDFEGAYSKGKYTYVSGNTKIKVNAEDDKSGVDKVYFSVNNKTVSDEYKDGIEFSQNGIAYIRVNAVDYVGNKSTTVSNAYFVDTKSPLTKISIAKPKHRVKDTLFITSNSKVYLSATDNASGVKEKWYSIGGTDASVYNAPFVVEGKGLTKITYGATDNVENKEAAKTLEVFIDDIPPVIYHHFSSTPIGTKTVREQEYTIYPSSVKLYIAATDENAGGERIEYSINGGAIKTGNPIKGFSAGNYEIEVAAYDVLGNASKETITFSVE
jgi:hypothetical protein